MIVVRFEWPEDMTETERALRAALEVRARYLVGAIPGNPTSTESTNRVFDSLSDNLFLTTGHALAGRVRIVVAAESGIVDGMRRMGVRVRFAWTKRELDWRIADLRRREEEARLAARRNVRPPTEAEIVTARYAAARLFEVTREELEAARAEPLNLNAERALAEAERLGEMGISAFANLTNATANAARTLNHMADAFAYAARGRATASPVPAGHPAIMIARFLPETAETIYRGSIVRIRESVRGTDQKMVRGCDGPEVLALIEDRQGGDRFYFIRADMLANMTPATLPMRLTHFEADPLREMPGTMAYAIAAGDRRRRDAVDLLVRIILTVNAARAYARAGTEAFLAAVYGALRAWASNPGLVELDIESAPFAVDLSPPADDTAARYALLELK